MEFNYASDYEGNEITELILETAPVFPFPKALDCKQPDGYCKIFPDKLRLCVPVVNDRVKLFYKDYKIITICRSRTAPYIKALPPTWTNPDAPPQLKTPAIHGLSRTPKHPCRTVSLSDCLFMAFVTINL